MIFFIVFLLHFFENSNLFFTFAAALREKHTQSQGEMAEWSNAVVLKTIDLHGSGGSNPSLSAES